MQRLIEYFDRAYIINLEDRFDRRKEVIQEFHRVGVDVPDQKVRFYTAKRPTDKGQFPTIGTRGCFSSHRDILALASEEKLPNVLVFEDDVSFRQVESSLVDQIVTKLAREAWDIAYFGYLQPSDADLEGPLVHSPKGAMGTHFYAVNGHFIDPLLQFFKQCEIRPPGHPDGGPMSPDAAMSHMQFLVPDMRVLLAVPNLAHQRSSRTDVHPTSFLDRIAAMQPLIRALRAVKHRLRMTKDRKRLHQRSNISASRPDNVDG
jgi:glycosyl transferase, family 25